MNDGIALYLDETRNLSELPQQFLHDTFAMEYNGKKQGADNSAHGQNFVAQSVGTIHNFRGQHKKLYLTIFVYCLPNHATCI